MSCDNAVPISGMTDVWNATGNYRVAIQMDVTDISSATNSQLINLLLNGVSQFAVDKNGCIITACPDIWIQNASQNGFGQNGSDLATYVGGNPILNFSDSGIFPTNSVSYDIGTTTNLFRNIYQITSSSAFPTSTEYPNSGAWGIHHDLSNDKKYLTLNNGAGLDTIEFNSVPIAAFDEGSLLEANITGFDFIGAGVTATLDGQTVVVTIPGASGGGGGSGTPLSVSNDGSELHADVASIDFTGEGVVATNIGNAITVTIDGGDSSFTGVSTGPTITGDGATNPLNIPLSIDSENILTVGTDDLLYVPAQSGNVIEVKDEGSTIVSGINSIDFVGPGVDTTNIGNDITVTISGGSSSFTGISVGPTITGDGDSNPINVVTSIDADNILTVGTDDRLYVPSQSGNIIEIEDEGINVITSVDNMNFVGGGVTVTGADGSVTISIPGIVGSGGSALTILDEGNVLDSGVTSIDFVGDKISATNVGPAITVSISGDDTLTNLTPMPEDVGGIPLGTSFSNRSITGVLDDLLYVYQEPLFNSFSFPTTSPLEVGDSVASGAYTFTWATENSGNISGNVINIEDVSNAVVIASGITNDGSESLSIPVSTRNITGSNIWRISATNTQSGIFSKDFEVDWQERIFYGDSPSGTLLEDGIEALSSNFLAENPGSTYVFTGSGYKYISYPTGMGVTEKFLDIDTDVNVVMESPYVINLTNIFGVSGDYYSYRTTNNLGEGVNIGIDTTSNNGAIINIISSGSSFTGIEVGLTITGDGDNNPINVVTSEDVDNILTFGTDDRLYVPSQSGNIIQAKDEGSILVTGIDSIDFVGSGVTLTNVGNDLTVMITGGGETNFDPSITYTFGIQQYQWTPMTNEATIDLDGSSPSQTTTLTSDQLLTFSGTAPVGKDRVYYAEIESSGYNLTISGTHDPNAFFLQPTASPFIVAFKITSSGTPRYAGVI